MGSGIAINQSRVEEGIQGCQILDDIDGSLDRPVCSSLYNFLFKAPSPPADIIACQQQIAMFMRRYVLPANKDFNVNIKDAMSRHIRVCSFVR